MNRAHIVILIDLQNGFMRFDLPRDKGGCLYVPGGENAAKPAAELIAQATNKIFILSQDFHPADHISFMENHPGVMALRRAQLAHKFQGAALEEAVLDVRELPFTDILLKKQADGTFTPFACRVGDAWHNVDVKKDRIVAVHETPNAAIRDESGLVQKLWRQHCVQGTESCLFAPEIMAALPAELAGQLTQDHTSPVLQGVDARGNVFFVVRKGMRSDLDSYGIGVENDQKTLTVAPALFEKMAAALQAQGISHVDLGIGGLATNFCVEYSERDVRAHLVPALQRHGMTTRLNLLTDISYGIPFNIPGGAWPDLNAAPARMLAYGTGTQETGDVLRAQVRAASVKFNPALML